MVVLVGVVQLPMMVLVQWKLPAAVPQSDARIVSELPQNDALYVAGSASLEHLLQRAVKPQSLSECGWFLNPRCQLLCRCLSS